MALTLCGIGKEKEAQQQEYRSKTHSQEIRRATTLQIHVRFSRSPLSTFVAIASGLDDDETDLS
jgi:hypothetical protein